ncbi:hypothetical protein NL676_021064 [Syzygium grande]|nr:hypothetical protein NL676_021064 [Syzygium grande]
MVSPLRAVLPQKAYKHSRRNILNRAGGYSLPREVDRARNCGGDGIGREGGLTRKAGSAMATAVTKLAEPWRWFLGVNDHELRPSTGERDPAIEAGGEISDGRTRSL